MVWIFIMAGIITIIAIITVLVAPGRMPAAAEETAKMFCGRNFAHRGLHTKDQSVPENSIAAFEAARDKGYGVELDVHLTSDNEVIVFHDHNLSRACGIEKHVGDISYLELSSLRLFETDEKIPRFGDVLDILGDTPVIVELKPTPGKNARLCEETLKILKEHGKNWCIQSFDPRVCSWFKKNAPDALRGQLSCPPGDYEGISRFPSLFLGNLLFNFLSRPHYIAYKNGSHPLIVKLCMIMKPLKAVWTVGAQHDIQKAQSENNIVIFEHYEPEPRFG